MLTELYLFARPELTTVDEYVDLLSRARTAPGLITFNAFIAGLVAPITSAALGLSNAD